MVITALTVTRILILFLSLTLSLCEGLNLFLKHQILERRASEVKLRETSGEAFGHLENLFRSLLSVSLDMIGFLQNFESNKILCL